MEYEKIWNELANRGKTDPAYQECLIRLQQREQDYLAVCQQLSAEQKEIVEDYISACEEIGDCVAILAYRLGSEG